ncbi:hypothetical protein [Roseibium aggregatum]|nr:hypothetical protein [Roseibium aggregatum]
MLELNGLDGFYGRSRALQSVSMDIDEGISSPFSAATAWARRRFFAVSSG